MKYIAVRLNTGFCCVQCTQGVVVDVTDEVVVVVVDTVLDVVLQTFFGGGGGIVSKKSKSPGWRSVTVWP